MSTCLICIISCRWNSFKICLIETGQAQVQDNQPGQCNPGQFWNRFANPEKCEPCSEGWWNNIRTGTKCFECPAGSFARKNVECVRCEPHSFSTKPVNDCTKCDPGQIAGRGRTTDKCIDCKEGTYPSEKSDFCKDCVKGKYNPERKQEKCLDCDGPGQYSRSGAIACSVCPLGSRASRDHTTCVLCGIDTHADVPTTTCPDCKDCPKCEFGQVAKKGQKDCTDCKAGTYADHERGDCLDCPAGMTSADRADRIGDCFVIGCKVVPPKYTLLSYFNLFGQPYCPLLRQPGHLPLHPVQQARI
jgi:Tyrosine-protein kinase ephrin type A/B receptor-like